MSSGYDAFAPAVAVGLPQQVGTPGPPRKRWEMLCMFGLGLGRLWLRKLLGASAEADLDLDAGVAVRLSLSWDLHCAWY